MPGPPLSASTANAWQNYQPGAKLAPAVKDAIVVPQAYQASRPRWSGHFCRELAQIDWNGVSIVPVTKEIMVEHPDTAQRSQQECERIRLEQSIHILNDDLGEDCLPKPIVDMTEMAWPDSIDRVLRSKGFQKPTSIQVQGWPAALAGRDIVGIAETGSGKTMAYVPPMLAHVLAQPELRPGEGPVGIVLVPSCELCDQVQREVEAFTADLDLRVQSIHGGDGVHGQASAMNERVEIVICTPGRLIHLLNQKMTNLNRATFVVLDEADELLAGGFEEQIRMVLSQIRPDRQICLFSATWPDDIAKLAREACSFKPVHINVGSTKLAGCRSIEQTFHLIGKERGCEFPGRSKTDVLDHSLQQIREQLDAGFKALVFCNKTETVHDLVKELKARGHNCEGFTGAYSQAERQVLLSKFRVDGGPIQFLVCTHLLGRGHDFSKLRFVINFDMPNRLVEYVHRIGRTGRGGERGLSLTLLELSDLWMARELVECLKETDQAIPQWLKDANTKKRRMESWQLHLLKARGGPVPEAAPEAEAAEGPNCWRGRGRGRLAEFLRECGGRGAAREVPL